MNNGLILKISKMVAICSIFIIVGMSLIFKDSGPIILGYVFGTLISILSLLLINNSVNKAVVMEPSKAQKHTRLDYFIRCFIYFMVLVISHAANYLNLFSAFLGLNMVKIAIYIMAFFDKNFPE